MLSSAWAFVKRHRRKLIAAGVLTGGLTLLAKVTEEKVAQWRREENRRIILRSKRLHHFERTRAASDSTLESLLSTLLERIKAKYDVEALVKEIEAETEDKGRKLELWLRLRSSAFVRFFSFAVNGLLLNCYLKLAFNVLGGKLFRKDLEDDSISVGNSMSEKLTTRVQEIYLSLLQTFVENSTESLFDDLIALEVEKVLSPLSLSRKLTFQEVVEICEEMAKNIEKAIIENGSEIFSKFNREIFRCEKIPTDFSWEEKSTAKILFADSQDFAQRPDFKTTAISWSLYAALETLITKKSLSKFEESSQIAMAKLIPAISQIPDSSLREFSKFLKSHQKVLRFSNAIHEFYAMDFDFDTA